MAEPKTFPNNSLPSSWNLWRPFGGIQKIFSFSAKKRLKNFKVERMSKKSSIIQSKIDQNIEICAKKSQTKSHKFFNFLVSNFHKSINKPEILNFDTYFCQRKQSNRNRIIKIIPKRKHTHINKNSKTGVQLFVCRGHRMCRWFVFVCS